MALILTQINSAFCVITQFKFTYCIVLITLILSEGVSHWFGINTGVKRRDRCENEGDFKSRRTMFESLSSQLIIVPVQ